MKARWPFTSLGIATAKIAVVSLIAVPTWTAWAADPPVGIRLQDFQEGRWLITTAAVASSAAILLLTRRNFIRVFINTPIPLASTILGIVVAFFIAGEPINAATRIWYLVLVGGVCGALVGRIPLAIGWAFGMRLNWRNRPPRDDHQVPGQSNITGWRWQNGHQA